MTNHKLRIREYCQRRKIPIPEYTTIQTENRFITTISLEERTFSSGEQLTQTDAEQFVAQIACEELIRNTIPIVIVDPESFRTYATKEYGYHEINVLKSNKFKNAQFITCFSKPDHIRVIDTFTNLGDVDILISKEPNMSETLITVRIGKLLMMYSSEEASFHIISRNARLNSVVEYLKSLGYVSERIDEL